MASSKLQVRRSYALPQSSLKAVASPYFDCQAFQIAGLRNGHHLWMVQGLAQALAHDELAPGVTGRLLHHALEARALDVVGTGKRHQHATRTQQLEGAQVDFFVATEGLG